MIEFIEMSEIKTSVQWPPTRAECSRLAFHHLSATEQFTSSFKC